MIAVGITTTNASIKKIIAACFTALALVFFLFSSSERANAASATLASPNKQPIVVLISIIVTKASKFGSLLIQYIAQNSNVANVENVKLRVGACNIKCNVVTV